MNVHPLTKRHRQAQNLEDRTTRVLLFIYELIGIKKSLMCVKKASDSDEIGDIADWPIFLPRHRSTSVGLT